MFGHAAGGAFATAAVFAGTEAGVTADLPAVFKPVPVADFAADDDLGELAEAAGQAG